MQGGPMQREVIPGELARGRKPLGWARSGTPTTARNAPLWETGSTLPIPRQLGGEVREEGGGLGLRPPVVLMSHSTSRSLPGLTPPRGRMILLAIGDVMGSAGRDALTRALPGIVRRHGVDFVIANGENLAHGAGITTS